MLSAYLLLADALAADPVPLVVAADIAGSALEAWWRPGELVVRSGPADRPTAHRPLRGPDPVALPPDLDDWLPIVPATCAGPSPAPDTLDIPETESRVRISGDSQPLVHVEAGDQETAVGGLGRPATVCLLNVGQADHLPGLEIMMAWTTPGVAHRGLTVWHIPESALLPASTEADLQTTAAPPTTPTAKPQ